MQAFRIGIESLYEVAVSRAPSQATARMLLMARSFDRQPPREALRKQRTAILALLAERGGRDVRVFGSLARGDEDLHSDIDLLVELPEAGSLGEELFTVLGLSEELSQLLGARVDVVTPRTLRDDVRDGALAEAIPL